MSVRSPRHPQRSQAPRRLTVGIPRWIALLSLVVLAAGSAVLAGPVGPAVAAPGYSVTDDLNTNPAQRWTMWNNQTGSHGFFTVGANTWGWVTKTDSTGWSEIGRDVQFPEWARNTHYCRAYIDLRASVDGSTSVANIEVIDQATWRYVSLSKVSVTGSTWHNYSTAWAPSPTMPLNLRFRVSLLGSGSYRYLGVDNLTIGCWTIA
jgi:hypothetical protein